MKTIFFAILLFGTFSTQAQSLTRFYENYKVGYKNSRDEIVVKPIYEAGSKMENGFALVVYNNKRGFIDASGKEVIPLLYDDATMFSQEGLAAVQFAGKYGYINTKGEWMIQPIFDNAFGFSEGLARVMKNNLYGFINTAGAIVIPCRYAFAYDFSNQLSAVMLDKQFGFIDAQGKTILPFAYKMATSFSNGRAMVVKTNDDEKIYINTKGKKIGDVPKHKEEEERKEATEKHEQQLRVSKSVRKY
jgi:WG containing repeat